MTLASLRLTHNFRQLDKQHLQLESIWLVENAQDKSIGEGWTANRILSSVSNCI